MTEKSNDKNDLNMFSEIASKTCRKIKKTFNYCKLLLRENAFQNYF